MKHHPETGMQVRHWIGIAALSVAALLLATAAHADNLRTLKDSSFACTDRAYFEQGRNLAVRDLAAAQTHMTQGIRAGKCALFLRGESVYLGDVQLLAGMTQIRRVNDTRFFWINTALLGR